MVEYNKIRGVKLWQQKKELRKETDRGKVHGRIGVEADALLLKNQDREENKE